jgi:hypothetical protein
MPHKDENERPKSNGVNRRQFITRTAAGAAGAVALTSVLDACGGSSTPSATQAATDAQNLSTGAWKFGVMSDTQWTTPPGTVWSSPAQAAPGGVDASDPNTCAVGILNQIQQQFINNGVKFVVHVGDLADDTSSTVGNLGQDTRALYAQPLYNAGIGFFPLRGNHDDAYALLNSEFQAIYPQTQNGVHNATPSRVFTTLATDSQVGSSKNTQPIPANNGSQFTVGSNFSSPTAWNNGLAGMSYSFDFNNVRILMLDQFTPVTGSASTPAGWDANGYGDGSPTTISQQQSWISAQLSGRASGSHAFVFAHKGLLTLNHQDTLFSQSSSSITTLAAGNNANPAYNPVQQNAFFSSLQSNGVRIYMNGHDHMYDRSLITSPDGKSQVMQIVAASDSSKFYPPVGSGNNTNTNALAALGSGSDANGVPYSTYSNDQYWNVNQAGGTLRRAPVTQELFTVGYYIVTVNGANVNVDYYSASVSTYQSATDGEVIVSSSPSLTFAKRESFGYSLNGQQYQVAQGAPYTVVQDKSSAGTTAKILSGSNGGSAKDANGLACIKVVNTGWLSASSGSASDILLLWGIDPCVESAQRDTFTLSMGAGTALSKSLAICALDSNGNWSNAVNQNSGGTKNFMYGPWTANYGLGTYGIDPTTNTAWAILNYDGVFAIASGS